MIEMRFEHTEEMRVAGRKTWIAGTDNTLFDRFWQTCNTDGFCDTLRKVRKQPGALPGDVFGVSRVEKDPDDRSFWFYIAAQSDACPEGAESFVIPAQDWAVFHNSGDLPMALVDAEMECFLRWLPQSGYAHAKAPELEVYPFNKEGETGTAVEFWLPITKKG